FLGIFIEKNREANPRKTKFALVVGIVFPLLLLLFFKYLNFLNQTISQIAQFMSLHYPVRILQVIIPLGISYYTFHSISYLVDIYRVKQPAERHLGIFSLYILFFAKMVAGPIERAGRLIPQFREEKQFDYVQVMDGLKLMAWGFFQKLVIADRAAIVVNEVFNHTQDYWGVYLIIGSFCFVFRVFCDFSGYSDIAIGAAQIFGIRLSINFKRPYFSTSIAELWRRWHITLIAWLRDYVYIPMGGKRVSKWRWQYNVFVTFILSGIWHGANWTYITWAALNGFYILFSIWTGKLRSKMTAAIGLTKLPLVHKVLKIVSVFLLFWFAAIFFRANSTTDAFYIISHLFTGLDDLFGTIVSMNYGLLKSFLVVPNKTTFLGFSKPAFLPEMITLALSIAVMLVIHVIQEVRKERMRDMIARRPWYIQWTLYFGLIFAIFFLGVYSNQQFLYFIY
ncbi:MAG: MBOAT family protein, partial [Chrysiogenales bacterium]